MAEYMYPPYVQSDGTIMRHYVCEDEGERDALGSVPAACTAYVKADDAFYIRQTNGTWVSPGGAAGPHDHDGVYSAEGHSHQGGGGEAFPAGSVFISVVPTDPATLLGYGTWSAFATGRTLFGIDSGDADFDTVEETGGTKAHTHSNHSQGRKGGSTNPQDIVNAPAHSTESHLPPYIVVYMWKRTA